MKIEFLTQDDPLYILPFFEEFFRHYAEDFEIIGVSCCRAMGSRPRTKLLGELTSLYGITGVTRLLLRAAVSRVLGSLPKRTREGRFHSFAQLCAAYGVDCRSVGNPNSPEYVEELGARKPDLVLSVACPYILKEKLLKLPPLGCVNIHHAPLPRYKGMMPTFWQMYHGEKTVGVTIHYMAPKVDEGDALLQEQMQIAPGETLDHLIRRSKRHGAHCMARVLRQIESGCAAPIRMDHAQGSYFTFPTREEALAFRSRGLRAI